jgi:5-methylcytosine-specific restriction endonuclease McrA
MKLNPRLRSFPLHTRKAILKSQGNKCANRKCYWKSAYPHFPIWAFETDHIIEFSKGGLTTLENGQVLCRGCHLKKSSAYASERWTTKLFKQDLNSVQTLMSFKYF